jgi:uncharacterized protein with PIN domain
MGALKSAHLRFYAELNDFLPDSQRQKTILHQFAGRPSIKDVVEGLGVPHTEVDLILIDSEPVGFDCHLKAGQHVSVYPVFESFDISSISRLRTKPLRKLRFIADVHLGTLVRYLRMLGFDTLYRNDYADPEIIQTAAAEQRVILTRDRGILKHKSVTHGYYVHSSKPDKQIQEVLQRFDLYSSMQTFTRCIRCNGTIAQIEKRKIEQRLQPNTLKYYNLFFICQRCDQLYWKGSHYWRMQAKIAGLLRQPTPNGKQV